MNNIEKKLAEKNGTMDAFYSAEIVKRVREKYSVNDELAILRQRDEKPEEFAEYNAFVEQCKEEAKKAVNNNG